MISVLSVSEEDMIMGIPVSIDSISAQHGNASVANGFYVTLTVPLPGNLVPRIAVAPWVVVDCLFIVNLHILLARAAGVEGAYRFDDLLALCGDFDGFLGVGFIVDIKHVAGVRGGELVGIWAGLVGAWIGIGGAGHD